MKEKLSWHKWFSNTFIEFIQDISTRPLCKIVDIFECKKTGFSKAVIKLSERHTQEKNISDIVMDNELIEQLDRKTLRLLTYMATVERMKPDYSIVVQHMTAEVDEFILEIKSKNSTTIKKSASELSKDKALIAKFNPVEANQIGYMAGVRETVKEYQTMSSKPKE